MFFAVLIFGVLMFQAADGPRSLAGLLGPPVVLVALLALGLSVPVAIRRRIPVRSLVIVLAGCLVTLIIGAIRSPGARSCRWRWCCTWSRQPAAGRSRWPAWPGRWDC